MKKWEAKALCKASTAHGKVLGQQISQTMQARTRWGQRRVRQSHCMHSTGQGKVWDSTPHTLLASAELAPSGGKYGGC